MCSRADLYVPSGALILSRKRISKDRVEKRIHNAIDQVYKYDWYLLLKDASERSIVHKLAQYLGTFFGDWDVDTEYNRNVSKANDPTPKTKKLIDTGEKPRKVFPDVIIHERGVENNFLVIEVKKSANCKGKTDDILKLRKLKTQIGYAYAYFLEIKTGPNWMKKPKYTLKEIKEEKVP